MSISTEKIVVCKEFVLEMIKITKNNVDIKNLLHELYVKLDTLMPKEPITLERKNFTDVAGERAGKSGVNSDNWAPPFDDDESDDSDENTPLVITDKQTQDEKTYYVKSLALRDTDQKNPAPLPPM